MRGLSRRGEDVPQGRTRSLTISQLSTCTLNAKTDISHNIRYVILYVSNRGRKLDKIERNRRSVRAASDAAGPAAGGFAGRGSNTPVLFCCLYSRLPWHSSRLPCPRPRVPAVRAHLVAPPRHPARGGCPRSFLAGVLLGSALCRSAAAPPEQVPNGFVSVSISEFKQQ